MLEEVILVDEKDNEIGTEEKINAHNLNLRHRAFSIFVYNPSGNWIMIQKRAKDIYQSKGLWSNTCCSHPRKGESTEDAAHRRLKEEMGFDCSLKEIFSFVYNVKLDKGIYENEYDHVFLGKYDGKPLPNSKFVEDWKWIKYGILIKDIKNNPDKYTYWLRLCIDKVVNEIIKN